MAIFAWFVIYERTVSNGQPMLQPREDSPIVNWAVAAYPRDAGMLGDPRALADARKGLLGVCFSGILGHT